MIGSFRCKDTEKLFYDIPVRKFAAIERVARRKLLMLHAAENLESLRSPPGNRQEALKGDRAGQYSIRVNDQWRICFRWQNGKALDVEIVDYHR
jgi:proteic killer suppression protein